MSTYTSEPGTLLAGRYRLVDQTSAGTGWTFWKATDETLARSVTVLTFASGFPRTAEAITAARAASRLGDPRFSQVFDVEDADEGAYVVLEWVVGESLLDMLAAGPLDAPRAGGQHVQQCLADHPLQHHVGAFVGVFHVEHLGETRVAEPARGPGSGDRFGGPREARREGEHGYGSSEYLVGRFPECPAGAHAR